MLQLIEITLSWKIYVKLIDLLSKSNLGYGKVFNIGSNKTHK